LLAGLAQGALEFLPGVEGAVETAGFNVFVGFGQAGLDDPALLGLYSSAADESFGRMVMIPPARKYAGKRSAAAV